MSTIWLIRHGESAANAGQPTENPDDIPLTEVGHEQAQQTSLVFARAPRLIVTSKYRRAIQTSEYTQRRFPGAPVETWDIHEFTYLSPTGLIGTTMEERRPLVQAYWDKCDPQFVHGPEAESFADFMRRTERLYLNLKDTPHDFVAVFCHGYVMKALFWSHLLGTFEASPAHMRGFHLFHRSLDLFNCAILEMQASQNKIWMGRLATDHLKKITV